VQSQLLLVAFRSCVKLKARQPVVSDTSQAYFLSFLS
jgi:hypothetical protein